MAGRGSEARDVQFSAHHLRPWAQLCESLLPTIFGMCTVVLIPLLPDLNSIFTVSRIESALNAQSRDRDHLLCSTSSTASMSSAAMTSKPVSSSPGSAAIVFCRLRFATAGSCRGSHGGIPPADPAPGPELSHDYLELALWVRRVAPLSSAMLLARAVE